MKKFNYPLYMMWIIIGAIPMGIFYLTTYDWNIFVRFAVGFFILEWVLLVVCPVVESKPSVDVFWDGGEK